MGSNIISNNRKIFINNSGNSGGSGTVMSVNSGVDITVDNTDPANPIINFTGLVQTPITIVANYSALPAVGTVTGKFYWASASQGTKWLPGALGGTFYDSGVYYSNGVTWEFMDVPYQATQAAVNTGVITDQFVTPATLSNYTGLTGKVASVSGTANRITSTGGTTPVIDISASYVGQSSITKLGTITTGTWSATIITGQYGGTGVNNAGTITNASNTTVTGGGTLGLGGFTLTVPATGTATLGTGSSGQISYWNGTNTQTGNANFIFDGTSLIIGAASKVSTELLSIQKNQNAVTGMYVSNTTLGTAARSNFGLIIGTTGIYMNAFSSGYTTSGLSVANSAAFTSDQPAGMYVGSLNASLYLCSNNTVVGIVSSTGIAVTGSGSSGNGFYVTGTTSTSYPQVRATNDAGSICGFTMYGSTTGAYGSINSGEASVYTNSAGLNLTANHTTGIIKFATNTDGTSGGGSEKWRIATNGNLSNTVAAGTAYITLKAGTATASTAPWKVTTGTLNTTAEAGAFEYLTPSIYFTNGGAQRQEIPLIQQSRVSTQFDKTTSTTLANITELTATLVAGKTYYFESVLHIASDAVGGLKVAIAGTATATNIIYQIEAISDTSNALAISSRQTALAGSAGVALDTSYYVYITGVITVNAAGTLTTQFSQNASNGTSSVLVGSTFITREMA
jgi:hypothetical protein